MANLLCLSKKKTFFNVRQSVLAGHLKNAFFDYIPISKELQVKSRQMSAKNYRPNLGMLRNFSAFSSR